LFETPICGVDKQNMLSENPWPPRMSPLPDHCHHSGRRSSKRAKHPQPGTSEKGKQALPQARQAPI
jgi:hypothetical protein